MVPPSSRSSDLRLLPHEPLKFAQVTMRRRGPKTPRVDAREKPSTGYSYHSRRWTVYGDWIKRSQSGSPTELFPGVANVLVPPFAKGDPLTDVNVPVLGSYHCALAEPLKLAMLSVIVADAGQYAMTSAPSEVRAAVT